MPDEFDDDELDEEDSEDLKEEAYPCDFCSRNATHTCFSCSKNGCDEHVLSVFIWKKKKKKKDKEKQRVFCCIECLPTADIRAIYIVS